ncbi:MAG: biosynthetic-type acetolactate synthase large subunit [Firmicutes bacterium]|nr:biosynthetic-type acetolactate synthase large subunit [Bacillota bacterium]
MQSQAQIAVESVLEIPPETSSRAVGASLAVNTGADLLCSLLLQAGVEVIFGYPGGAVLPIYDALFHAPLRHILTRHEQGAIHAAQGYARVTGRPGIVLATSGPGATNLVTGLADAFMDSTPLVVITGQVVRHLIGSDAFQEADIVGITMPITKHNYQIRDIAELPQVVADAFYLACSGRPGPVLIDMPKDVSAGPAVPAHLPLPGPRGYRLPSVPEPLAIARIRAVIAAAKRPLLYIGGGIISAGATELLREFARRCRIPVTTTLMGLGVYPEDDELFVGMLGMHGKYAANHAITDCDVLIALGVRFDDRVTGKLERFSPHSVKIHVDVDGAEINKNVPVHYPLVADVRDVLAALNADPPQPDTEQWRARIAGFEAEWPLQFKAEAEFLKPQAVIELLAQATGGTAVVTTDVGQHQMWAALFYPYSRPRQWVTSGGLGTMGFGFPAAMGAQVALPDATVICVTGDGSLQMNIQELQTVVENGLPVKVAIINNGFLGMVRQWQQFFHGKRYAQSKIGSPDFVRVAEAFGALGLRATTPSEAAAVIEQALAHPGPVFMDFVVREEENVFPMVPAGKGNDEMTLEWEEV